MVQDIKWDSLERRREVSHLTLLRKQNIETVVPFPSYLVHSVNNTRGHSKRFIQVPDRTEVYAKNYFNRTRCLHGGHLKQDWANTYIQGNASKHDISHSEYTSSDSLHQVR